MVLFFSERFATDRENRTDERNDNSHRNGKEMRMMEVRSVMEHYEIYKDGEFVCSCDASELSEVLNGYGEAE